MGRRKKSKRYSEDDYWDQVEEGTKPSRDFVDWAFKRKKRRKSKY